MELYKNTKTFYAVTQQDWRNWLLKHHNTATSVWLIIYKKSSKMASIYYPEAVDEALCFGWIDSVANKKDEHSYYQFFSKRNSKSNWSKINKDKVARLLQQDLIAPAGLKAIEIAKQNGTWIALETVDKLEVPNDMQTLLNNDKTATTNWANFAPSTRRGILEWILNAKRPDTRQKRIEETVSLAAQNIKANQYR
jgi:uncharacterized protein YdeI (YjbR/CyaY-like superfamily)